MTQYEIEKQKVIEEGGDLKAFEEDWHRRACACYRENVKTIEDINKFRCGGFTV